MSVRTQLDDTINRLIEIRADADKFDNGNDSAGARVRKSLQAARTECAALRNTVQATRTERKAGKTASA